MASPGTVFVGLAHLEVHLPDARSLKEKRSSLRGLVDRIKHRHKVLVVESNHQDLHQRATLTMCALSTTEKDARARLQRVEDTVHEVWAGFITAWDIELLQL